MPTTKRKKEDLVQAGKAVGQNKLSLAKNSKTIDEVSYLSSFVLRSSAKLFFFQLKSNRRHCMKHDKIWAFSDKYFPSY